MFESFHQSMSNFVELPNVLLHAEIYISLKNCLFHKFSKHNNLAVSVGCREYFHGSLQKQPGCCTDYLAPCMSFVYAMLFSCYSLTALPSGWCFSAAGKCCCFLFKLNWLCVLIILDFGVVMTLWASWICGCRPDFASFSVRQTEK